MSKIKQVIVVRKDLKMRQGKTAAQVAHASMKFMVEAFTEVLDQGEYSVGTAVFNQQQHEWLFGGSFTKVVVYVESEQELLDLIEKGKEAGLAVHPIIDEGVTEFNNVHTLTCAAFGPAHSDALQNITGHLKLL